MVPLRLDRAQLVARLEGEIPRWILDPLLDAYEPAFLASVNIAGKGRRASRTPTTETPQ